METSTSRYYTNSQKLQDKYLEFSKLLLEVLSGCVVCEWPSSLYRPKKEKNPCYRCYYVISLKYMRKSVINIVLLCHANVCLSDIVPSSGVLHVMPKELNFSFLPKLRGIKGNTHSVLLHSISFHYLYIFHFSIIYSFHSVINSNEA